MPVYNYACQDCGAAFTARYAYAEVDDAQPICPACESRACERRISTVNIAAGAADNGFKLTKEHVQAAAGMANLMQGADGGHSHSHGGGCGCNGSCGCSH